VGEPLGRAETLELLDRHAVRLRKSLGQHFLVEPNVVRRIVELSEVDSSSRVVEVGAGAGTLTRALVDTGATVVAYEIDPALRPVLAETVGDRADIRIEDAASIDLEVELEGTGWALVANLPYNVGTPLVLDVLRQVPKVDRVVVMLQREAVDRLSAAPGSRQYGVPSVVVALHSRIETVLRVSAHLFVPVPAVESSLAVIDRASPPANVEEAIELAARAFGQRRKMLRSSLRARVTPEAFVAADVDPTRRAEDVAPEEWVRLAEAAA